jgi:hypothetical protein
MDGIIGSRIILKYVFLFNLVCDDNWKLEVARMPRYQRAYTFQELQALRAAGKTLEEIGKQYGITKSAVAHALSKYETEFVKAPIGQALTAMSHESLSAMRRLNHQAEVLEKENQYMVSQMEAADPETAKKTDTVICPECKCKFETLITNYEAVMKTRMMLQDRVVKNAAEIRQQLEVVKQVMKEGYNLAQVEQFKILILEEIGRESPETQKRILERIKHSGSSRQFNSIGGSGIKDNAGYTSSSGQMGADDQAADREVLFRGTRIPEGHSSKQKQTYSPEERIAARSE